MIGVRSCELAPGTSVRHKKSGLVVVLARRNGFDALWPGWWLEGEGGLADFVLDGDRDDWEILG